MMKEIQEYDIIELSIPSTAWILSGEAEAVAWSSQLSFPSVAELSFPGLDVRLLLPTAGICIMDE